MRMKVWGEISGERHLVGTLETIPGREEQFSYAESYLESEVAQPLSVRLPLPGRALSGSPNPSVLPEPPSGRGCACRCGETLEVKNSSYLKVLDALGSECIGALILKATTVRTTPSMAMIRFRGKSWAVRSGRVQRALPNFQEEAKLSLAGAQSKMGLYVDRSSGSLSQYFLPQGTAASTHIVKAANRQFEQLSENEYCCLAGRGRRTFCARVLSRHHRGVNRSSSLSVSIAWCFLKMIGELVAECGGFNGFTRRILPGAQPPAGAQVRRGGVRYAKKVRDVLLRVLFGSGARYRGVRAPAGGERRSRKLRRHLKNLHRASGRRLVVVCIGACVRHRLDGGIWGASTAIWPCASGRPTRSMRLTGTIFSLWRRS